MAITPRGARYAVNNVQTSTGADRQTAAFATVTAVGAAISEPLSVGTVVFFPSFAGTYVGNKGDLLLDESDIIASDSE